MRTCNRQSWTEESMTKAIDAVKNDEMGIKKASRAFNVPITTLRRRARGKNKRVRYGEKDLGGRKPILYAALEKDLTDYLIKMEMFFGLRLDDVRRLAYQLAKQNGLIQQDDGKERLGPDWAKGFLARHKVITLRTPEATSAARARGFNRAIVTNSLTSMSR